MRPSEITSSITRDAADGLGLAAGVPLRVLTKSTEAALGVED